MEMFLKVYSYNRITGLYPGRYTTAKDFNIGISFFQKLFCPTDRRFFPGSGAVEDNLLVF